MIWQSCLKAPGLGIATESLGVGAGYGITWASATRISIVLLNGAITGMPRPFVLELSLCGDTMSELSPEVILEAG